MTTNLTPEQIASQAPTPSREAFEIWWDSDEAFAHRHEETQEQAWAAWQARDAEIASARADQKAAWDTVRATHKAYEGERLLRQGLEAMNAELRKQLETVTK